MHTAVPDTVGEENPLVNFRKMANLSSVISCLTKVQDQTPICKVNTDLIDTLKLALDLFYSDEEIFELSLAREPRAAGNTAVVRESLKS